MQQHEFAFPYNCHSSSEACYRITFTFKSAVSVCHQSRQQIDVNGEVIAISIKAVAVGLQGAPPTCRQLRKITKVAENITMARNSTKNVNTSVGGTTMSVSKVHHQLVASCGK
jgi:hypothetical protein